MSNGMPYLEVSCPDEMNESRFQQPYGDLVKLNKTRTVADAIEPSILREIIDNYLDLLLTSAAVYERNGDYAFGIFTSGWCRFMDRKSRDLCSTGDNSTALNCGKWRCHESCWATSKMSIDTGRPADMPCEGGINIYAVPILANGEIVGSINFGYGEPPKEPAKLQELATRYNVSFEELSRYSSEYHSSLPQPFNLAKRRIEAAAKIIGQMVEKKHLETQLRASLMQKEVLLKEIHHRVKNNLQITSGLLRLQSRELKDSKTKSFLLECENRVKAMALVHEKLCHSADLSEISTKEYLSALLPELFRSLGNAKVELETDIGDVTLPIDCAIPFGLLVNELVSNSLKHAFKKDGKWKIAVGLSLVGGALQLSVADNGIGFPAGFNIDGINSLGLKLVADLCKQLKGHLEFNNRQGAEVLVTFPM